MDLKGLILNTKRKEYDNTSWSFGKNFIITKDGKAILNEGGFDEYASPPNTIIGSIRVADTIILCSSNSVNHEIGKLKDGVYTTILRDKLLNFNLAFPILGGGTYNHKNELIVAFTDDYNLPVILNIDNLPFKNGLNEDYSLVDKSELDLLHLFPNVKNPKISKVTVNDTGGTLLSGVYSIAVSYIFEDGDATARQELSNPIMVTDDNSITASNSFNEYDGCEAGTPTPKSITIDLTQLDTNFNKFKIAIIAKIGGVVSAYESKEYQYSGDSKTILITDTDTLSILSVKEVLTLSAVYSKIRAITVLNNKLYIGNMEGLPIIDYQEFANNIIINWYRKDFVALENVEGSYKDSTVLFFKKGFRSGEVYGFYIGLRLKAGGYYGVWHIPGRPARATELDILSTNDEAGHPYHHIGTNVKRYQVKDTSTDTSGNGDYGIMSYWENENEQYANDFPNFAGQNVRHHKFPDLAELESYHKGFITEYTPSSGSSINSIFANAYISNVIGSKYKVFFSQVLNGCYGHFINNNTILVSNTTQVVNVNGTFNISKAYGGSNGVWVKLIRTHNGATTDYINTYYTFDYTNSIIIDISVNNINLDENDQLDLQIYDEDGTFVIDSFDLNYIGTKTEYIISSGRVTKPLGIKVSNVVIPPSLLKYVDGWEIFYAERTSANMTKLGQDVIFGSNWHTPEGKWAITENIKIHPFDLMTNRLAVSPTYINRQLKFTIPAAAENVSSKFNAESTYINRTYADNKLDAYRILPCKGVNYLPPFIYTTAYDNTQEEDGYLLHFESDILSGITIGSLTERRYLADICAYKTNVYMNYLSQMLVSTGYCITINPELPIQVPQAIYGGDTTINKYAYKLNKLDTNKNLIPHIICESISNIGLRHKGKLPGEIYFPKNTATEVLSDDALAFGNYYGYNGDYTSVNNYLQPLIWSPNINLTSQFPYRIAASLPKQTESVALNWRTFRVTDYYEMTSDKGTINMLTSDGNQKLFIAHTHALFIASKKDVLDTQNSQVYLKEGEIFDRVPMELIPTDTGYIGNQSRFATFICKHGYFTIDIEKAKVYLINEQGIATLSDDTISEFLEETLKLNIEIEEQELMSDSTNTLDSDDNGTALLSQNNGVTRNYHTDNPFVGTGLSAGYDDVNDRFIITNNVRRYTNLIGEEVIITDPEMDNSGTPLTNTLIEENINSIEKRSFTISYNIKHKMWVAFHDYIGNAYIPTRTKLLIVVNHGNIESGEYNTNIYSLNSKDKICKFPNIVYPTIIDIINDASNTPEVLLDNLGFDVNISNNGVTLWDKTLSAIMIYTRHQCTGEIPLVITNWQNQLTTGNVKNFKGLWMFNAIKDKAMQTNIPFLNIERELIKANIFNEVVTEILSGRLYIVDGIQSANDYIIYNAPGTPEVKYYYNGQIITPIDGVTTFSTFGTALVKNFKHWFDNSNIYTNFATIRLIYSNIEQLIAKINNIQLNIK